MIKADIEGQTEKSYRIQGAWFPKSLCFIEDGIISGQIAEVLTVPEWLKNKKDGVLFLGPYEL